MFEYKCAISRVVDGDTVDVNIDLGFDVILKKQRVRLYGVDTPESRTSDKEEKKFGKASKQYVIDFLKGKSVTLITREYDAKGKFGRILGDFIVEGNESSLSESLIRDGYGAPYFGQSKDDIDQIHLTNRVRLIEEGKV